MVEVKRDTTTTTVADLLILKLQIGHIFAKVHLLRSRNTKREKSKKYKDAFHVGE